MGLDITLRGDSLHTKVTTGIYVREGGENKLLTYEEAKERFPGSEIEVYSYETDIVWEKHITHNLTEMADEADLYKILWRPHERLGVPEASEDRPLLAWELYPLLSTGLSRLVRDKEYLLQFNPKNGWGDYDTLLDFVKGYLIACIEYPEAIVEVSR